jgi:hypothetical protein
MERVISTSLSATRHPVRTLALVLLTAVVVVAQGATYQVRDGMVVVEAEDFVAQSADETRRWHVVNASNDALAPIHIPAATPQLPARPEPDPDRRHATRAVGGTYVVILPDTRRTDQDRLTVGVNFSNTPGSGPTGRIRSCCPRKNCSRSWPPQVDRTVPPPRLNLVRYHGVLAPHAADRSQIVPGPKAADQETAAGASEGETTPAQRRYRLARAVLLARVFQFELTVCDQCGGKVKIVAAVTDPGSIGRHLEGVGLPARAPPIAPHRPHPQREFDMDYAASAA